MLDRSPDELNDDGLDDLDSDSCDEGTTAGSDGDGGRVIYPWMQKVHVAGVCKYFFGFNYSIKTCY